ncbi:MAG: hypothetical protein LBK67_11980, partial [Coriobacteriales bacterium]|nr:hypothetical protein [Coriobacteriales bacterium]
MEDEAGYPDGISPKETGQNDKVLDRARLDALLDQALTNPVTNVVAGAGYGKSIAVSSYLRRTTVETVWVQLSEKDNMPSHFWETLSRAFVSINPALMEPVHDLGFPETEEMMRYFISLLRDEKKSRFFYALVLDDLHLLKDGPVLNFIVRLCPYMGDGTSAITISRRDNFPDGAECFKQNPPFRIDESDLAFTKNELTEYFDQRGISVSPELVIEIYNDTEGWPFAISLAARLLEMNPDDRTYIHTMLKSNFNAIIEQDLFSIISEDLRHFLLKLSLVKHLSPDLIREFEKGEEYMNELIAVSSFMRYDHYMHVYRIHHLLLKFLESKSNLLSEQERRDAFEKAAQWCAANGYKLDAMTYYRLLGDYSSVINISYTLPFVMPFDIATELLEIIEQAPPEIFDDNPDVYHLHVRLIMTLGRIDEAIAQAFEYIKTLKNRPRSVDTNRTLMALYNSIGFAKLVISLETHDYDFARYFEDARAYFEPPDEAPAGGFQVYNVGPYALRIGRGGEGVPEAYIETMRRAVACTTRAMRGCMHGLDELIRSEYAYFRGRSSEAENFALRCISAARDYGQFEIESRALFLLLRAYLQRGKYDQIMDVLAQLEALTNEVAFANRFLLYEIISSWFFAVIGEADKVESWLKSDLWSKGPSNLFDGLDDTVKT